MGVETRDQNQVSVAHHFSKPGFVLTDDDATILELILNHRFLRRDQLSTLTQRHPKRLHRRLSKLEHHGFLTTLRFPQQSYIYGLARGGVDALVEQGRAEPELMDERLRTHELTELFLRHEMMIVDIHVRFSLASATGPVRLVHWREGSQLHDSVIAMDSKGSNKLPVRPDAFFTLLDTHRPEGNNRLHFMLEADRSTTSHTRFQEKLRAYWAYFEQGGHAKKFSIKGFRVLTITLTAQRAENLSELAASVLPERARKRFLFASVGDLQGSQDPISESLYGCPTRSHDLQALLPKSRSVSNAHGLFRGDSSIPV